MGEVILIEKDWTQVKNRNREYQNINELCEYIFKRRLLLC